MVVSRSYGPGRYDPDYENRHVKYPIDSYAGQKPATWRKPCG